MFDLCNEILHINDFRTLIISVSIDLAQVEITNHFQAYYMLRTKLTEHACLNLKSVLDLLIRLTEGFD